LHLQFIKLLAPFSAPIKHLTLKHHFSEGRLIELELQKIGFVAQINIFDAPLIEQTADQFDMHVLNLGSIDLHMWLVSGLKDLGNQILFFLVANRRKVLIYSLCMLL